MTKFTPLKLAATDVEDLQILAAATQDAVGLVGDLIFDAKARRFALALNRFRWEINPQARRRDAQRVRSFLAFESVLRVRSRNIRTASKNAAFVLLTVHFETGAKAHVLSEDRRDDEAGAADPGGVVRLTFAGEGEISLDVECLDALLVDVSEPWPTRQVPQHGKTAKGKKSGAS